MCWCYVKCRWMRYVLGLVRLYVYVHLCVNNTHLLCAHITLTTQSSTEHCVVEHRSLVFDVPVHVYCALLLLVRHDHTPYGTRPLTTTLENRH